MKQGLDRGKVVVIGAIVVGLTTVAIVAAPVMPGWLIATLSVLLWVLPVAVVVGAVAVWRKVGKEVMASAFKKPSGK